MAVRLQKYLSRAGVCSRRRAEKLISNGKVTVNGTYAKIGDTVDPQKDVVEYNEKRVELPEKYIYIALNKPKGYVSTKADPHVKKTIYDLLPKEIRNKVHSVGRLDKDTKGLILFTNDGALTEKLTHPRYEHEKEYVACVEGELTDKKITRLETGVRIGGAKTAPAQVVSVKKNGNGGTEVSIVIHEGAKRQVRRMFEAVGNPVRSLERIRIGDLTLQNVPPGTWMYLTKQDIVHDCKE